MIGDRSIHDLLRRIFRAVCSLFPGHNITKLLGSVASLQTAGESVSCRDSVLLVRAARRPLGLAAKLVLRGSRTGHKSARAGGQAGMTRAEDLGTPSIISTFGIRGMQLCCTSVPVRMTVLASGSRGNCTVLSNSNTSILVDAGLSCRETFKRMKAAGEDPQRIRAIVISHEHADHVAGLPVLARKLQVPVYITEATYQSWRRFTKDAEGKPAKLERREHFQAGRSFAVDGMTVTPFTISHDAADPCGFTFQSDGVKYAIVTDL